ncbi:hypothetical protein A9K55_006451 [Cordyceps militaris]|uniref:Uncharacterized protein n=1 Tax=Cordyceps militaris TaxID=73501 RepID=A0A2H4SAN7_CORMI|nr:hypothetical protein A9K55_006451 [Cordyceps militaris]
MAPPDALPVAAAALSNRVSMLFAAQSSLLRTLSASSSSGRAAPTTHRQTQADIDEDEALFKSAYHPGGGVGYVPPAADTATSNTDRELRGRILGKRGPLLEREKRDGRRKKKAEESDEDEDVGRSALGKRKRPRREVRDGAAEVTRQDSRGEAGDVVEAETQPAVEESAPTATAAETTTTKRKRNKKKKNKNKAKTAENATEELSR